MKDRDIQELFATLKSCENNRKLGLSQGPLEARCQELCNKNNWNISHGTAFKEVRHKYYYYRTKYIEGVLKNREDKWSLYKNHYITSKEIVDSIFKNR